MMNVQTLDTASVPRKVNARGHRRLGLWIMQIAVAVIFLATGAAKLAGVPKMVATFDEVGVGQWFRYATGAMEITSAVGLLVPAVAPFAAVVLAVTMVGALAAHVLVLGGSAAPAALLLIASGGIAWARRDQLAAAWDEARGRGAMKRSDDHDRIGASGRPGDVRQYWDAELRQQILRFRPQHEPGHDTGCPGITEDLESLEGSCAPCRRWLAHLLVHGKVFGSEEGDELCAAAS